MIGFDAAVAAPGHEQQLAAAARGVEVDASSILEEIDAAHTVQEASPHTPVYGGQQDFMASAHGMDHQASARQHGFPHPAKFLLPAVCCFVAPQDEQQRQQEQRAHRSYIARVDAAAPAAYRS